jgi:hypothetical protein
MWRIWGKIGGNVVGPKKEKEKGIKTKKGQKNSTIVFDCLYWLWLTASGAQ